MSIAILGLIALVALIALLVLLAAVYPGSGADLLDWDPRRFGHSALDEEDLKQLLETENRWRREKGLSEIDEEAVRRRVADDLGDPRER
jgi:hypothetical protein